MFKIVKQSALLLAIAGLMCKSALPSELIINFNDPNPASIESIKIAVKKFREKHNDINVSIDFTDRETQKNSIQTILDTHAPDIISWYPGHRMATLIDAGQFQDVSDLWNSEQLGSSFVSAKSAMTYNAKQWGVPYTSYQWGIYYRRDIFDKYNIQPPKTWKELLSIAKKFKEAGLTPFTIGTKYYWTAASVFDYLNLRSNGYYVYIGLTSGNIKYSDQRIVNVFDRWRGLIDPGYFISNHAAMDWREALVPFVEGEAAMYIIGNFAVAAMRDAGLKDSQFDYFPFPTITADLAPAEEATIDAFFIPSNALNKQNAREFLKFVAEHDVQTEWNERIGQLPLNRYSKVGDDKFLKKGFETLITASDLAQSFDRDAPAEMARSAMEGFQEFMIDPDNLDNILKRLDVVQESAYK